MVVKYAVGVMGKMKCRIMGIYMLLKLSRKE